MAAPQLHPTEQEQFLRRHIPYRLERVDLLAFFVPRMDSLPVDSPALITFGGVAIKMPNARLLTNDAIEMGSLWCRLLLEFLGIKEDRNARKQGGAKLRERTVLLPEDTDVGIEQFERNGVPLPRITIQDLRNIGTASPDDVEAACLHGIMIGSTAVAHLTFGATPPPDGQKLLLCAVTVRRLIEEFVYSRLGEPIPPPFFQFPPMKERSVPVTTLQRRNLEAYQRYREKPPSLRYLILKALRWWVIPIVVTGGFCVFVYNMHWQAAPGAAGMGVSLLGGMVLGMIARDFGLFLQFLKLWPALAQVLDWKRLDDVLSADQAGGLREAGR